MHLTDEQLRSYHELGYLFIPGCFSPEDVRCLTSTLPDVLSEDSPRRVLERDGETVRSVYGCHKYHPLFGRLARHPALLNPSMQLLDGSVYVYQFKINIKSAFGGDIWEWHQDYIYWLKEDNMLSPRVINATVWLDDLTPFNGPMFLIPRSHREGLIDVGAAETNDLAAGQRESYRDSPTWISNLVADIKYKLDRQTVEQLARREGIVSPTGPAGSVLFFDGNIAHASPNNISPFDRRGIYITYNSTENVPVPRGEPRPDFLMGRDVDPLTPLPDDTLAQ